MLLRGGEGDAFGYVVPFVQAASAATGAGVLRNKDGVPAHGRLLAVVGGQGGSKPLRHKVLRVLADGVYADLCDVILVFL